MIFNKTPLNNAFVIELEIKEDERGFFARSYCKKEFSELNLDTNIVSINNSLSIIKGTLRGIHYQIPPKSETKIVRCTSGSLWDVIVLSPLKGFRDKTTAGLLLGQTRPSLAHTQAHWCAFVFFLKAKHRED